MRSWVLSAGLMAMGVLAAAPAAADDWSDCLQDANLPLKIQGCTRTIDSTATDAARRARAYNERGYGNYLSKKLELAVADFDQALRLSPNTATILYNRCNVLIEQRLYDRAIADCSKALELNPGYADARAAIKDATDRKEGERLKAELERQRIADFERQAREEAARKAREEADRLARVEAARKAEAERLAKIEADRRAKEEADRLAKPEADRKAEAERVARVEAERKAKEEADRLARAEAARKAEAERLAKIEADRRAKEEADRLAKLDADRRAEAERLAKLDADRRAKEEADRLAKVEAERKADEQRLLALAIPNNPGNANAARNRVPGGDRDNATRVALVIGNSAYATAPRLAGPVRDAAAIGDALRRLNFTVRVRTELGLAALQTELDDFARLSETADWSVVYFAGHGREFDGTSYAVPVDARLARETHLPYEAITLGQLKFAAAGARELRLVIFDACREPACAVEARGGAVPTVPTVFTSATPINPTSAVVVAYSARQGQRAIDDGGTSVFATALLENIEKPDLEVAEFFRRVGDSVLRRTGNRQEPVLLGELGAQKRFFNQVR